MVENVAPGQTWDELRHNAEARLVDVRTPAEWTQIGVPDLQEAGKQALLISWQGADMQVNRGFVDQLRAAGLAPSHHVYFLCRSGARSMAAAQAAQAAGFSHVYNVANGFEGMPDAQGQRSTVNGWKADGLPWKQG